MIVARMTGLLLMRSMLVAHMLVLVLPLRVHPGLRSGLSTPRLAGMATAGTPRPDLDQIVPQHEVGFA
jgi:hypothetical protein